MYEMTNDKLKICLVDLKEFHSVKLCTSSNIQYFYNSLIQKLS